MKRKIIAQAGKANTITLPIDWVRENGLKAGSEVDVQAVERSLVINAQGSVARKKASVNADGLTTRSIRLMINALYARGVDEIQVVSRKDISGMLVEDLSQNIGFALVGRDGDAYTIRDVSGADYSDLDSIYRHTFQTIIRFAKDAALDMFGPREQTLDGLKARDLEVNKLSLFLQRAVAKMAHPDNVQGKVMFAAAFQLEKIGDEVERSWRHAITKKPRKELKKVAEQAITTLEAAFSLQNDRRKIDDIYKLRDKTRQSWLALKQDASTLSCGRHLVALSEEAGDLTIVTLMRMPRK